MLVTKNQAYYASLAVMGSMCGRFVSITFKKKDGTITKRNGKLAKSPKSHENHANLFTLTQYQQKTPSGVKYASINASDVIEISANGQKMKFFQD